MADATIVIAMSSSTAHVARHFLPTPWLHAEAADRLYLFYPTQGAQDVAFDDLIEMHSFPSLADAHAWVNEDARQRQLLLTCKGTMQ